MNADIERWRLRSRWLDTLLELEPAARARKLAELAHENRELADELQAMLATESGPGPLDRGLGPWAQEALSHHGKDDGAECIGQRIGPWTLIRGLGRGGMGEVFLAQRSAEGFVQRAALKRLKRGMDSEDILHRFLQERRILASLAHPNIARLLDGGVDADGRPYIVMEHVEGAPITDWAHGHGLPLRERLALMRKVCAAVAYAQGRLVVHRDLKPSNILVDAQGEPHLLDFGIAKLLDDAPDAHHTRTGLRALSPAYAAPEQIRGEAIGTATDVHALGVVLYELLTGQLPYRRGRALTTGGAALAEYDSLVRPSQALRRLDAEQIALRWGMAAEPARLARLVAGDLDRIVLTALQPEPERRYASAAALGADLGLYLDGRPIHARPDSSGYRLRKFVLRHRLGAAATALALIALVAGFGTALWQARIAREQAQEANRQRELAELHLARARTQARRAEKTRSFVVSLIKLGNPERSRDGAQTTAIDLIRDAAAQVDALDDAPDTRAELQVAIANSLIALGAQDEGRARMETGIAQLRTLGEDAWPALADALHLLAMHDTATGRQEEARAASEESLALYDRIGPREDLALGRISTLTTLAKNALFRGDLAAGQQLYERILAERRALLGPDDPRLAVDWNNLGATATRRDRYADAERAYAEASRLLARDANAPQSRQAWLQLGRSSALIGLGRFDEAEASGRAALEIAEHALHPEHPIAGNIRTTLARLYRYTQRLDEAAAMAERARAIHTAANATQLGWAEAQLGLILLRQGRNADALLVLTAAENHFATQSNREEADYFQIRAALAFAQIRNGDAGAVAMLDAALEDLIRRHPEPSNARAETLALRAEAASLLGHEDAAQWREREVEALAELLGPGHPRSLAAQRRLPPPR